MPPSQIGPYRIVKPLGEGGMGTVYEAIQESIQRRVALKVLLPQHAQNLDALTRFFNEARAVNLVEHPSLVQISECGQAPDGTPYLVMEYLHGETLSVRLDRLHSAGKRLAVLEALQIASQVADALSAAHDKAIVHRDLKPANVMLVRDPVAPGGERVKILDFGIAKLMQGQAKGTEANVVMGTPMYMSPEQCRGAGGVDVKTDVYALGVMLYEMIAGRPPFVAESALEYMALHAFANVPSLQNFVSNVPTAVAACVLRLLTRDKSFRPAMAQASAEISRIVAQLSSKSLLTLASQPIGIQPTRLTKTPAAGPSTLDSSQGQTLQPLTIKRARTVRILAATVSAVLVSTVLVVIWRDRGRPHGGASNASEVQPRPPAGSHVKSTLEPNISAPKYSPLLIPPGKTPGQAASKVNDPAKPAISLPGTRANTTQMDNPRAVRNKTSQITEPKAPQAAKPVVPLSKNSTVKSQPLKLPGKPQNRVKTAEDYEP